MSGGSNKLATAFGLVTLLCIAALVSTSAYTQRVYTGSRKPSVLRRPLHKYARALQGPDTNAVYMQLKSGDPSFRTLRGGSEYWEQGEIMIRMDGFSTRMSPGNPMLPYQQYDVALPPDADPRTLRLEVTRLVESKVPKTYRVAPALPNMPCHEVTPEEEPIVEREMWGPGREIVNGRNVLVYGQDELYPVSYCRVAFGGDLRKWKVATVTFHPVRYNPVTSELVYAREIDIKISFSRIAAYFERPGVKALLQDNVFDPQARDFIMNFDQALPLYRRPLLEKVGDAGPAGPGMELALIDPDYAIITTEATFGNSAMLDDFCFHKENLGYEVIVVTEHQVRSVEGDPVSGYSFAPIAVMGGYEDVAGAPAPGQRPEKLRKWLQDNYAALGIKYVLLIGNPDPDNVEPGDPVGDLPMKDCQLHVTADVPTDFYFAELSPGNWDLDGDGLAGEYYTSAGETYNIPAGVTDSEHFSARWQGILDVDYPAVATTTSAAASVGDLTIDVTDATGFSWNHYVRIGAIGDPNTETLKIYWIDGNQFRLASALAHDHPAGVPVEMTAAFIRLVMYTEGNTKVWFDADNNGIDESDVILPYAAEHRPYKEPYYEIPLSSGQYPIRVDYKQMGGDAFCDVYMVRYGDGVTRSFKHDDGTGTFVDRLDGRFYNSEDFSGVSIDALSFDYELYCYYVEGGDMGAGGVEFLPEIIVGRIPMYDVHPQDGVPEYTWLDDILTKMITYENADPLTNTWRRDLLVSCPYVADSDDDDYDYDVAKYEWAEMLRDDVAQPPLWDWYRIHEKAYPGLSAPAEVNTGCSYDETVAGWNDPADPDDGRGAVMWMSHGGQTYASKVIPGYRCDELDDSKPSIVFMGACYNGKPEYGPDYWNFPLGYTNLRWGAVGTVSATRASYG